MCLSRRTRRSLNPSEVCWPTWDTGHQAETQVPWVGLDPFPHQQIELPTPGSKGLSQPSWGSGAISHTSSPTEAGPAQQIIWYIAQSSFEGCSLFSSRYSAYQYIIQLLWFKFWTKKKKQSRMPCTAFGKLTHSNFRTGPEDPQIFRPGARGTLENKWWQYMYSRKKFNHIIDLRCSNRLDAAIRFYDEKLVPVSAWRLMKLFA